MTDEELSDLYAATSPGVWGYDATLALQIRDLVTEVRGWRESTRNATPKRQRSGRLERVEDERP